LYIHKKLSKANKAEINPQAKMEPLPIDLSRKSQLEMIIIYNWFKYYERQFDKDLQGLYDSWDNPKKIMPGRSQDPKGISRVEMVEEMWRRLQELANLMKKLK
jgi:uncharacterized protein YktA (UPF0223 family)